MREDRGDEDGGGLFGEAEIPLTRHYASCLACAGDAIGHRVRSDLLVNSGSGSAGIVTPKAVLAWKATDRLEFYANCGEGQSNDVRGATIRVDPTSGDPAERVPVFARSRGADLGMPVERGPLTASLAGFCLELASELVLAGDVGSTEFGRAGQCARAHGAWLRNHALPRGARPIYRPQAT